MSVVKPAEEATTKPAEETTTKQAEQATNGPEEINSGRVLKNNLVIVFGCFAFKLFV